MKPLRVKCSILAGALWILLGWVPGNAPASDVRLELRGSRVTLVAPDGDLADVLRAFAAYGVRVEAPDDLHARVNVRIDDADIHDVLAALLDDYNHSTLWREIPVGPGRLRLLEGIHLAPRGAMPAAVGVLAAPVPGVVVLPDGRRARADEILIGLAPGTTPEAFRALLNSMCGHVVGSDAGLGVYRVRLPRGTHLPDLLERLSREAVVAAAEPNLVWNPTAPVRTGSPPATLPANRSPTPGSPALAILDSGLREEFREADYVRSVFDATGTGSTADPVGHGTQMALLAAGMVAPLGMSAATDPTPVIAIRTMEADGLTSSFGILSALTHAREQSARVVGMSWGAYQTSAFLDAAFAQAADAGLILLAASGNDGADRLMYPASSRYVLAVGALEDGALWPGTNTGDELDLLAPGIADLPVGSRGDPGRYAGTSVATATAAHVIAEYLRLHPTANRADVLRALNESTQSLRVPGATNARVLDPGAIQRLMAPE